MAQNNEYAGFPYTNQNIYGNGFLGYYVRIKVANTGIEENDWVIFNDPAPKREGLLILPHLVQTHDSGVLASGSLDIKTLKKTRTKIQMQFPVMTPMQFRKYYGAIMQGVKAGKPAKSMKVTVEYYNQGLDEYETGVFYHNDVQYKPVKWKGREMIDMQEIHLIER